MPPALDENTTIDFNAAPDFLAKVGRQWEMATFSARDAGVRVVNMRFGVVLGNNGGVLSKLKLPYSLGLGGRLGSGQQPFPWIALPDLLNAIDFIFANKQLQGAINFVAPQSITQQQFSQALATAMHRPALLSTPTFLIKILLGEMGETLLLNGQHVEPRVLLAAGFKFEYPDINSILHHLFS